MARLDWMGGAAVLLAGLPLAQGAPASAPAPAGPYARIAFLRAQPGKAADFEDGYVRHLEWHRQARDPFAWYGWTIWAGERQRWFVYATFGHAGADFDAGVAPAEDERDTLRNVSPHVEWLGSGLYEFLPALSRGTGVPEPTPRLELTTVDLVPGAAAPFELALAGARAPGPGEALWYRMLAGGPSPRYLRLRPRPSLAAILESGGERDLPAAADPLVAKATVEILTLRPALSYGLPAPARGRP